MGWAKVAWLPTMGVEGESRLEVSVIWVGAIRGLEGSATGASSLEQNHCRFTFSIAKPLLTLDPLWVCAGQGAVGWGDSLLLSVRNLRDLHGGIWKFLTGHL